RPRLNQVEERNEGRPTGRVPGDDALRHGAIFLRKDRPGQVLADDPDAATGLLGLPLRKAFGGLAHRSASPMTGSRLATEAITSATSPPWIMAGTAWRLTKLGARMCTR